jgi:hypothetical protein
MVFVYLLYTVYLVLIVNESGLLGPYRTIVLYLVAPLLVVAFIGLTWWERRKRFAWPTTDG